MHSIPLGGAIIAALASAVGTAQAQVAPSPGEGPASLSDDAARTPDRWRVSLGLGGFGAPGQGGYGFAASTALTWDKFQIGAAASYFDDRSNCDFEAMFQKPGCEPTPKLGSGGVLAGLSVAEGWIAASANAGPGFSYLDADITPALLTEADVIVGWEAFGVGLTGGAEMSKHGPRFTLLLMVHAGKLS